MANNSTRISTMQLKNFADATDKVVAWSAVSNADVIIPVGTLFGNSTFSAANLYANLVFANVGAFQQQVVANAVIAPTLTATPNNTSTNTTIVTPGAISITNGGNRFSVNSSSVMTGFSNAILGSSVSITGGATSATPTLTAGPLAGNPTKWLPYNDNGVTRYIPAW